MYTFLVEDGSGIADATSYATVAQVDEYATFWNYADWSLLAEEDKEKLLIRATRFLDEQVDWRGEILTTTQGLRLPRKPYYDPEGRLVEGIPSDVIEAVSELAILFEDYSTDELANIKVLIRQQYGDSEEEYATGYVSNSSPLYLALQRISARLKRYGLGGKSMNQVRLSRG